MSGPRHSGQLAGLLLPLAVLLVIPATHSSSDHFRLGGMQRHSRRPLADPTSPRRNNATLVGGKASSGPSEGEKQAPGTWEYLTKPPMGPEDMQWLPVVGGGGGTELAATAFVGETVTFDVSNCSRIARGVGLPDWAKPPGSTIFSLESGAQELCTACDERVEVVASLYPAKKDAAALSASTSNCTDGRHTFSFKMGSAGIWNLRVLMAGHSAVSSPIIRCVPPRNWPCLEALACIPSLSPLTTPRLYPERTPLASAHRCRLVTSRVPVEGRSAARAGLTMMSTTPPPLRPHPRP